MEISLPLSIFCPKCGSSMKLGKINDPKTQAKLEESGYIAGARGICPCGVTAVLTIKEMPANPTFTLMFNLYKLEAK